MLRNHMMLAVATNMYAGWLLRLSLRSASSARSSPAMCVSGCITSGTARSMRRGSERLSMLENW